MDSFCKSLKNNNEVRKSESDVGRNLIISLPERVFTNMLKRENRKNQNHRILSN